MPRKFGELTPKVAAKSGVPVLLPSRLRSYVKPKRVHPRGSSTRKGYDLELGVGRHCNGANVCFLAAFFGTRGGTPSFTREVALAHGTTGYFKPVTCGASCSPAVVQWQQDDVLYEIQFKGATQKREKRTMKRLANSAIRHGAR